MLLFCYSICLVLGSVCLVRGAPIHHASEKQPHDASSSWPSHLSGSSSSSPVLSPTFRKHDTFQKIHITNTNANINANTNTNPIPQPSSLFSPSFLLTNPTPSNSQPPSTIPYHWPRKIYGLFIKHARHLQDLPSSNNHHHQHLIIESKWLSDKNTQDQSPSTSESAPQNRPSGIYYALMRHLRRADRVWAPAAILFAMAWLAVLAMGVVECVSMCWGWGRMMKNQRQGRVGGGGLHERVLFDGGLLEEVVIEAVPVDEEDEDEEGEGEVDGGDRYKVLKKQ